VLPQLSLKWYNLELRFPGHNEPYDVFRYQVIRLWEEPLARLLAGGLGTLALAPLTDEGSANLPQVLRVIDERLRQEAPAPRAARIWAATFVLMGMRYPAELSEALFQGVMTMEESTNYQLIVKRGRIQEARAFLLRQGRSKFGVPADAAVTAALERITDLERLESLGERLLHVSSWQDLLAESSAS
jgi:predicted transposase YdaD